MRVSFIKHFQPSFKAHFYEIKPKAEKINIKTDNNPYLGEKPNLEYKRSDEISSDELPMEKNGNFYGVGFYISPDTSSLNYRISYKDTGKTDLKDGEDYNLDVMKLMQTASVYNRIRHKQPLIYPLKKGEAQGRILYKDIFMEDEIESIKEPTILVTKNLQIISLNNNNVKGVILINYGVDTLSHASATLRSSTDMSAVVFDSKTQEKLQSLNGKKAKITALKDSLKFEKTENNPNDSQKDVPKIIVPKMRRVNKILISQEYEKDTVGAKAFNLKRLEDLVEKEKIDVIIPKSVAVPFAFIEERLENRENYKEPMQELMSVMEKEGINSKSVMVRSAFNGEDLPNYSAAGLYKTTFSKIEPLRLWSGIASVAASKNGLNAINSRKKYGIKDEDIKPTVLIQNEINADYYFTIYTDDSENNLRIELKEDGYRNSSVSPYVFLYNKETGELQQESIQEFQPSVTFDENLNIVDESPIYDPLSDRREECKKLLKNVVKNALVVEKEFGKPQDIEGGITFGDEDNFKEEKIYFWQTRNIVK